ncbi:uncharacterized protein L203_104146 [Cryptococcus depauperatus CBS 7841]|uniref:Carboxymuconolactone decarboxylase-like domain-containing protein n=1 Tax=Cryptococcus depauperatus CBS 7841 TaxID=1295531 RepID=A0AAJ8JV27_9TREE
MSSGVKHGRSIRPSSGVAKAQDDFGNEHLVARTLPTTTQDASIHDLFAWSRQAFPERWRQECWYLTTAAALIASGQQSHIGALYQHVVQAEHLNTPESRKHLVRRLRETMIKCIILNGIPKVMLAFHSLAAVEQEQDQDHSFTRAGWTPDKGNHARAVRHLNAIYRGAQDTNHAACGAHADVEWISTDISYGLFLSDHSVLDITESQLVILPAIMCQDLKGPTDWHLRGCLRLGLTREEVDAVQRVVERIVTHGGGKLSQIGSVWDIQDE